MRTAGARMGTAFGLMLVLLAAGSLLAASLRQSQAPFDIGDLSGADWAAAREAFEESQSNGDLVTLVKILCYRWKVQADETAKPDIVRYGTLLLDRARAGDIDLEKADDPEIMLPVLAVVREAGAR